MSHTKKSQPILNQRVLSIILACMLWISSGAIYAINNISTGWQISAGSSMTVDLTANYGDCRVVTAPAGKSIFVPTKTAAEWNSFKANAASLGATLSSCAVNGVCWSSNGTTGPNYPSSGFCAVGAKVDTDTSGTDGSFNWTCLGTGGWSNASCSSAPYAIHCIMRFDNDCGYSWRPNLILYTSCGNFWVWRTDWGYANVFPIPGQTSCSSSNIIGAEQWASIFMWYDPWGDPVYNWAYQTPGSTNFWLMPFGWMWNIWNWSCDDGNYLYCGIW